MSRFLQSRVGVVHGPRSVSRSCDPALHAGGAAGEIAGVVGVAEERFITDPKINCRRDVCAAAHFLCRLCIGGCPSLCAEEKAKQRTARRIFSASLLYEVLLFVHLLFKLLFMMGGFEVRRKVHKGQISKSEKGRGKR